MTVVPITREQALERLVASGPEIRAIGVHRLALFGSVVRNEARSDSDVDLLVQSSLLLLKRCHRSGIAHAGGRRECPSSRVSTSDETLQRAFVRSLEIIGEATKKVP